MKHIAFLKICLKLAPGRLTPAFKFLANG